MKSLLLSSLLTFLVSPSIVDREVDFGCVQQFAGDVSYDDNQLHGSLLVRFRNNYHCYSHCDWYRISISPDAAAAKKHLGMWDFSKTKSCTEWYRQYYAPKAMIRTNNTIQTFSTKVSENAESSEWVAIQDSLKFNTTHWKIVLNKPIEVIQVPLLYVNEWNQTMYSRLDFQKSVIKEKFTSKFGVNVFGADKRICKMIHENMSDNPDASNEVLLFQPEYTLTINHKCFVAINMMKLLKVGDVPDIMECVGIEKNDYKIDNRNHGWHPAKQCTHDEVLKRHTIIDDEPSTEDITFCKTLPSRPGDEYVSCEDGQRLQTIPKPAPNTSAKLLINFATAATSMVPFIGNILTGVVFYLDNPTSFKTIASGLAGDLKLPLSELTSKADIITKLVQVLAKSYL